MLINMTFPRTNDSHRNALNYRIDSQTPENTSHFAMRITLFSSLLYSCHIAAAATLKFIDYNVAMTFILIIIIIIISLTSSDY